MNTVINIAFLDIDRFFVAGAYRALSDYFSERGIEARCSEPMNADLVFQAIAKGDRRVFAILPMLLTPFISPFTISEKPAFAPFRGA